jgi:hypothetical protein
MEIMVHPAAWRCGCYLSSGVDSTKRRILFFKVKNTSNIPVDNGSSLNTLIIKPTSRFINIAITMDTVLVL